MNKKNCEMVLLVVAIFWGLGIAVTDVILNNGVEVFEFISVRFFIGFVAMSIYYKNITKISKREWVFAIISGSLLFFSFAFQTWGLKYTTVSNTSLYVGTTAMMTPFTSYIISKKKIFKNEVIAGIILLFALYVNASGNVTGINVGDILVLISSLLFAFNISIISKFFKNINKINMTSASLLVCSILSAGVFLLGGSTYNMNSILSVTPEFLFVGVVCTAIAFFVQNKAVDFTSEAKISYILATESIWGVVFAIVLFNEQLTLNFIIASILVAIGFIISEYF